MHGLVRTCKLDRHIGLTRDAVDLSTTTMESALAPLGDQLSCESCRRALQERLKTLLVQWSAVKVVSPFILKFLRLAPFRELFSHTARSLLATEIIDPWLYPPFPQKMTPCMFRIKFFCLAGPFDCDCKVPFSSYFPTKCCFLTAYHLPLPPIRRMCVYLCIRSSTLLLAPTFLTFYTRKPVLVLHESDIDRYSAYELHLWQMEYNEVPWSEILQVRSKISDKRVTRDWQLAVAASRDDELIGIIASCLRLEWHR